VSDVVFYAVPVFVALMVVEGLLLAGRRRRGERSLVGYEARDTRTSLLMGVGNVVVSGVVKGVTAVLFFWLYEHRLFDLGTGPRVWVALFFAEDLTYYAWHRASHEVRFLWAAHENHHSSEHFNLSTALRQSLTTPFTTPLFYWWLPLFGFHPVMMLTQVAISLLYQFWIHTELIDRLPRWFEAFANTPSHHRVHHGTNVEYLDRNHGGILIVWDRLFGTFEPERARVVYGLTKQLRSFDLRRVAFHDWVDMLRAAARARSWREALGFVLAPPGWSPDGSTLTAKQLRLRAGRIAA